MITAEDFLKKDMLKRSLVDKLPTDNYYIAEELMIEFAKLHVKLALKKASDLAIDCGDEELADSILEIYPLENIK